MALLLCFGCRNAGLFWNPARFLSRLSLESGCSGISFAELMAEARLRVRENCVLKGARFEVEPCWPSPPHAAAS